jgi:hypothetical protein
MKDKEMDLVRHESLNTKEREKGGEKGETDRGGEKRGNREIGESSEEARGARHHLGSGRAKRQ